jgi:glyoxylase-like metal-dependent hydrolase (beta-lactamase superfamily II)
MHSRLVHTITDRFSMANTYIINAERMIVVDPGNDLNVRQLQRYLSVFLQRPLSHIDLVVLTHLHPDHTAGVEALRRVCSAPVAASAIIKDLVQAEHESRKSHSSLSQLKGQFRSGPLQHLDLFPPNYIQQMKLIDIWLNDVEGLPGHPDWRVIASPGHTPESLCLYNPFSKELLCGDTVITVQWGAPLLRGGTNRRQLEETLRLLRKLHIHYLYPGHGRPILGLHPLNNLEVEW